MPLMRALKPLSQLLTSCHKVASTLNWNKSASLLAVRLSTSSYHNNNNQKQDQMVVDLAICPHPSQRPNLFNANRAKHTPTTGWAENTGLSIPMKDGPSYLQDLLTKKHHRNIQGIIVGWPRQPDGWLGYQCGQVLHLLDSVVIPTRPAVCLYDFANQRSFYKDDAWGRNPIYGRITVEAKQKQRHVASQEQYHVNNTTVPLQAAELANMFCQEHWPEYYQEPETEEMYQEEVEDSSVNDFWAPSTSFHGSLIPRSSPWAMMPQQQGWMGSPDPHATEVQYRSLASA